MERRKKYKQHKINAEKRNISWHFTYISWSRIWIKSGHWHERGRHKDQYVMSRPEDKGPYAPWNVRICTVQENHREDKMGNQYGLGNKNRLGKPHSSEARKKISRACKGQKRSDITKARISAAMMGNTRGQGRKGWTKEFGRSHDVH